MLKAIRNPARKIEFKDRTIVEPAKQKNVLKQIAKYNKQLSDEEINKKLEALEKTSQIVGKIQEEIENRKKALEQKEKFLIKKEQGIEKMAVSWTTLKEVNLKDLKYDEIMKIASEQTGFIRDLLEYYLESEKKQKLLQEEIRKIKEKPWAGKSSSEIIKENQELKKKNDELIGEIERMR